jgi:PAS domain S-box-containing protein
MHVRQWANLKEAVVEIINRRLVRVNPPTAGFQRPAFTEAFILLCQVCAGILLAINFVSLIFHPNTETGFYCIGYAVSLVILFTLSHVNRKGHTSLSGAILLGLMTILPAVLLTNQDLDRSLIVYVIPILAASFIFKPGISIFVAITAILSYSINYWIYQPVYSYNYLMPILSAFSATASLLFSVQWDRLISRRLDQEIVYKTLVDTSPNAILASDLNGIITMVNPRMVEIHGYSNADEMIGRSIMILVENVDWERTVGQVRQTIETGRTTGVRYRFMRKDGVTYPGEVTSGLIRDEQGKPKGLIFISRDISDLVKAENDLQQSQQYFREITEGIREYVWLQERDTGRMLYASPAAIFMWGMTIDEINENPLILLDRIHPQDRAAVHLAYKNMELNYQPANIEFRMLHPEGDEVWVWARIYPVRDESGMVVRYTGIAEDITHRKLTERALMRSEEKFSRAFQISPDPLTISRLRDDVYLEVNQGFTRLSGFLREEAVGKKVTDVGVWVNPLEREQIKQKLIADGGCQNVEVTLRMKAGDIRNALISARLIQIDGEECILMITRDIHDQKLAELALKSSLRRIEQQVQKLTALRQIDAVILANFDLRRAMEEILSTVKRALEADAARILVPQPGCESQQDWKFATLAWVGDTPIDDLSLRTELYLPDAELAAITGQAVYRLGFNGFGPEHGNGHRNDIAPERGPAGYRGYACTPLLYKGQLKGVLEVFYKDEREVDPEWTEFFGSLSMQLTIAIHNADLYDRMELAAKDLASAYEETIAGWSHALELRDKETKGHSERVTDLTVRLALVLGMQEADIPHLRRGVLLHDIGKMGIPDHILLKPGPLTEDEWIVMRQHPVYARDLIAPIPYLAKAVDIPYYHHEKWDGTGYPCGLKGEEIPLMARIFAVVDVWDALTSDRPYRGRWPEQKVWDYLFAQSGHAFDPHVVDAFVRLLKGENE